MIIEFKTKIIEAINNEVKKASEHIKAVGRVEHKYGQLVLFDSENPIYNNIYNKIVNKIPDIHTLIKTNLIDIQHYLLDKNKFKKSFFARFILPQIMATITLFVFYFFIGLCIYENENTKPLILPLFLTTAYYYLMKFLDRKFGREFANKITFWPILKENINLNDLDRTIKIVSNDMKIESTVWGFRIVSGEPASEPVFGLILILKN